MSFMNLDANCGPLSLTAFQNKPLHGTTCLKRRQAIPAADILSEHGMITTSFVSISTTTMIMVNPSDLDNGLMKLTEIFLQI